MIPRSIRPPPPEQDSKATPGWAARSRSSRRVQGVHMVHPEPLRVGLAGPPRVGEAAVEVPLHVVDRRTGEQPVELLPQVLLDVLAGEVQYELIAQLRPLSSRLELHPVGVRAVQLAVRVDHLRLDPDPELHPQRVHLVGERLQAGREAVGVGRPVAEPARSLVRAPNQPSSTTNSSTPIAAARRASAPLLLLGDVELRGLPGVVEHRPVLVRVRDHIGVAGRRARHGSRRRSRRRSTAPRRRV